ncbi:MAG: hypothetical protein PHR14_10195 [Oscillospiraceae bacterium]|nr:hypothetical protein [Oscillospiraceae bacterium]
MALKLSGVVLSCESEVIDYTSKKTGNQEKLVKGTIILQGADYGVLIGSVYNPKTDLATIKQGAKLAVEVGEYKNDRGIQSVVFRM